MVLVAIGIARITGVGYCLAACRLGIIKEREKCITVKDGIKKELFPKHGFECSAAQL
jgi:hypothetical protein